MAQTMKPLYDRILVQRLESAEEKTSGGIIIPDAAKEKGQTGKVVAAGAGRLQADGTLVPLTVKSGDIVFFGKYAGTEAGKDLLIIREDEVLAIIS
jgi:chaperonin GroES